MILSFLFVVESVGKLKASKSREMHIMSRRTMLKRSTSTPRPSVRTLTSVLSGLSSAYTVLIPPSLSLCWRHHKGNAKDVYSKLSVGIFIIKDAGLFLHTSDSFSALRLDLMFSYKQAHDFSFLHTFSLKP